MSGVLGSLLEGFEERAHPRGFHGRFIATFHHPVHGRTTSPIEASSPAEAWRRARARARESGSVVQNVVPHKPPAIHSDATRGRPSGGSSEQAVRKVGAQVRARGGIPKAVNRKGPPRTGRAGFGGIRTHYYARSNGEVHGYDAPNGNVADRLAQNAHPGEPLMSLGFASKGSSGARSLNGGGVVLAPAAGSSSSPAADRHGGFNVGDSVTYREPSIVNGKMEGYGPPQTRKVSGLQRNGYLRLREPKSGTTVDVHHSKVTRHSVREAVESLRIGALLESFGAAAPGETPAQSMAIGAKQQAQASSELKAWNASKHPRGRGGKFGYTTGGRRAKKASSAHGNTLHKGSSGALVRSVQKLVGAKQDGKYGPQTKAAVERFQRQHGLLVDGIVGRQTLAGLRGRQGARKIKPGPIAVKQARVVKPRHKQARAPVRRGLGGLVI